MRRAVALARRGLGHTRPNPAVGAVVVRDGRIVGEGWHVRAGGDHAEVAALKKAGKRAAGATVYVTLEPCSKPGRVGACTDALIAAKVARVVYAVRDPNPKNRGKAPRVLAQAGIACERFAADAATRDAAEDLIRGFRKSVTTGLPYVTVKLAMSLDGRICDDQGDAKWISSVAARRRTGRMRAQVDAIMVGAETVRRDDPSLLSREEPNDDLLRLVVTRTGRGLKRTAQVFSDAARRRTILLCVGEKKVPRGLAAWAGGEDGIGAVLAAPTLEEALRLVVARTGVTHILCEGGLKLAVSLAQAGLSDSWLTVLAPKVIGSKRIAEAVQLKDVTCLLDL